MHRDIKGANILVEKSGRIKLADFGMAKTMVEQLSLTKSFKGSAYWMAPEVIRQKGHGVTADIWSVGCTVLEMATGKPPWSQCSTQVQAIFKIASSQELPTIPEHLFPDATEFILLCLQRDPTARPSAEDLLEHSFCASRDAEAAPALAYAFDMTPPGSIDPEPVPASSVAESPKVAEQEPTNTLMAALNELPPLDSEEWGDGASLIGRSSGSFAGGGNGNGSVGLDSLEPGAEPDHFRVRGLLRLPPMRLGRGAAVALPSVSSLAMRERVEQNPADSTTTAPRAQDAGAATRAPACGRRRSQP